MSVPGLIAIRVVKKSQSGQAIVELAMLMPILIIVLLGIVDLSPAFVGVARATQAARAGADYAHYDWTNSAEIKNRVKLAAPSLNLTDGDITATCYTGMTTTVKTCASAVIGDSVNVQVNFTYRPITGFFASIVGSTLVITRSMTTGIY